MSYKHITSTADISGTPNTPKRRPRPKTSRAPMTTASSPYGQKHPVETEEKISDALQQLKDEIDGMPEETKQNWLKAKERCTPKLVDYRHLLLFLRCEVFNVDLAAGRLIRYWDKRVLVFGEDRAFLPLTLDGALKGDETSLEMAFIQSTEHTDTEGRRLILGDPSKLDKTKYTRESMVRAFWYTMHAALEDEATQKRGIILLLFPHHAQFSQFDRKLVAANAESMKGCLPVRIGAFHICHPPTFFTVVFPIIKLLLGKRLRERIKVHTGSEEHVLERLAGFGIPKESIPSDLGGAVVLNQKAWLENRRESGL